MAKSDKEAGPGTDEALTPEQEAVKEKALRDQMVASFLEGKDLENELGDVELTPEDIAAADFSLPIEFQVEAMASELLDLNNLYQRSMVAWQAAKNSGDRQKAEAMYRQVAYARLGSALIQTKYKEHGVRALADKMAEERLVGIRNRRNLTLSIAE